MKRYFLNILILISLVSACTQPKQETKPIRKDVVETVFAAGTLEANNTYNLTAQVDGYLLKMNFKEGDFVQKGKVLAVIDNQENSFNAESATVLYDIAVRNTQNSAPALMQAQKAVDIAKQKMEQDQIQEQRYKRLLETNSVAKTEYESALLAYQTSKSNSETAILSYKKLQQDAEQITVGNKAQKQVNQLSLVKNNIVAVVNGKVFQKHKQVGDYVKRGDVIATIGDANFIYAKVNIDEGSIAKVKVGQEALIQLNSQKNKAYKSVVFEIMPSFDEEQQSFICKLKFTENLDFSIIKTQLQSNITVGTQKNALLIPRNYLDYGGFVYIKDKKEKVKVETNFASSEWVQVISGIDENVILETTNIKSEAK